MKKIYLAALTLAMTACVSNDDLNPVDNYGYIDVNVSNDPVMVTRATVSDISSWTIKANNYNLNDNNKVPAGSYTVIVSNVPSEEDLYTDGNWGDAFYKGEAMNVEVTAGKTETVSIDCGKAKNSRLKVEFKLNENALSSYYVTPDRHLVFNKDNMNEKLAYYNVGTEVNYTLNYSHTTGQKTKTGNIKFEDPAKEYKLKIESNDNGTITITEITYDDSFDQVESESITFDAATGEQVTNQ